MREHLKVNWRVRIRRLLTKYKLGFFGKNIYIDNNVKFQRYPKNISIENDVVIKEGCRICVCNKHANIIIGRGTSIGFHNFIFASNEIIIGENCLIAPFVYLVDSNHTTNREKQINKQKNTTAPIKIGDDVWLSSNVTILKGVSIGDGAVIAANSVVNNNVPSYEIWGGSPAKKINVRE